MNSKLEDQVYMMYIIGKIQARRTAAVTGVFSEEGNAGNSGLTIASKRYMCFIIATTHTMNLIKISHSLWCLSSVGPA